MNVAGMRRPGRWHGALAGGALLGLAAAVALAAPSAGAAGPPAARAAAAATCAKAQGPFHVKGTQVIGKGGKVFIPYGITVPGLFLPRGYPSGTQALDDKKIAATASSWCGNTVRLQISQAALVGPASVKGFMGDIEQEVATAEAHHLVVVLNDQTENDKGGSVAPTQATLTFWQKLAARYRNDPQVVFDVFNEPRLKTGKTCGSAADWHAWKFGKGSFIGMQELVTKVTGDEAPDYKNLLWVEGPCFANSLSRVTSFPVTSKKPLVVYVFHHPAGGPPHSATQWNADFGFLVKRHIAAVVDGEWTNYAPIHKIVPPEKRPSECWTDAPTAVPAYLRYLQGLGIGMTGYQLAKGLLIESNNLGDPTHFRSNWSCAGTTLIDEGAGSLIRNWYKKQNAA
jgi:Cellulase (glycosyl hydrolase family 5)